jgi:hypothetical protein
LFDESDSMEREVGGAGLFLCQMFAVGEIYHMGILL